MSEPKVILITGVAGFIGSSLAEMLLKNENYNIIGIDNLNEYYDINLKNDRLNRLKIFKNFKFIKIDLVEKEKILNLFYTEKPNYVINLAAQAGVRYSLENPQAYIDSNITGFLNILEACRNYPVEKLIYASSSSVYGRNTKTPFDEKDEVNLPSSLYATTKRSNELMAETYYHLFKINSIGLRFFTVYGPWGRPDMAPWLFADSILNNKPIKVFNNGNMKRDFTYIDDIVNGIVKIIKSNSTEVVSAKIYNIGHGSPVNLLEFIETLENYLEKKAIKQFLPMQKGDVEITWANTKLLEDDYEYLATTNLNDGIKKFADWFKKYKGYE